MSLRIGVGGKGGSGKTTFAALLIRYLKETNNTPILAVDADPNSCLGEYMGIKPSLTLGSLREETLKEIKNLPLGMVKQNFIEYKLHDAIVELESLDLITMGRPEGPGCYCYINSILRRFVDALSQDYRFCVIDNEAGMEYLSRRTSKELDHFFIISEPTNIGLRTAERIRNLIDELNLSIKEIWMVFNKVEPQAELESKIKEAKSFGLKYAGWILQDKVLEDLYEKKGSIFDLPSNTPVFEAVKKIIKITLGDLVSDSNIKIAI
jgi:CO dehydrogenase maturation factor